MGDSYKIGLVSQPAIYYLYQDNEIVYIGASKQNFHSRIGNHLKTKIFDQVKYEPCPLSQLLSRERELIRLHNPVYNIMGNALNRDLESGKINIKQYEDIIKKEKALRREQSMSAILSPFQSLLKKRRKDVIAAGFKASTVSMWIMGNRTPLWESAVRLSALLDLPINKVPYRKVSINQ
jgi:GIY-YIG catalytic domain.